MGLQTVPPPYGFPKQYNLPPPGEKNLSKDFKPKGPQTYEEFKKEEFNNNVKIYFTAAKIATALATALILGTISTFGVFGLILTAYSLGYYAATQSEWFHQLGENPNPLPAPIVKPIDMGGKGKVHGSRYIVTIEIQKNKSALDGANYGADVYRVKDTPPLFGPIGILEGGNRTGSGPDDYTTEPLPTPYTTTVGWGVVGIYSPSFVHGLHTQSMRVRVDYRPGESIPFLIDNISTQEYHRGELFVGFRILNIKLFSEDYVDYWNFTHKDPQHPGLFECGISCQKTKPKFDKPPHKKPPPKTKPKPDNNDDDGDLLPPPLPKIKDKEPDPIKPEWKDNSNFPGTDIDWPKGSGGSIESKDGEGIGEFGEEDADKGIKFKPPKKAPNGKLEPCELIIGDTTYKVPVGTSVKLKSEDYQDVELGCSPKIFKPTKGTEKSLEDPEKEAPQPKKGKDKKKPPPPLLICLKASQNNKLLRKILDELTEIETYFKG